MKPAPAPHVPGKTEFERFDYAVRKMFTVSKEDVVKEERKQARARARKKRAKANGARSDSIEQQSLQRHSPELPELPLPPFDS